MIYLALFAFLTMLSSAKTIPRSTIEMLKQASEKSEVQVGDLPGTPWEDYPAYTNLPVKLDFSCSSRSDGGYYADSDFGCQIFHICSADGAGGLARYDFACPIGTIFNQEYYICDWWFNFDCPNSDEATWKTSGPDTEVISGYYEDESLETNVGGSYSHGSNNNKPNAATLSLGTGRKEQQSGEKAVHASKEILVGEKMKLVAAENSRLRKANLALLKALRELN